jgi:hypothetical protein
MINESLENRNKIEKAIKVARDAHTAAIERNRIARKAADDLVSQIQKTLNAQLVDEAKASTEAYNKKMEELGLSSQVYPLETAIAAIDQKAITPVIATVGTGTKKIVNLAHGIGSRFMAGFATK